MSPKFRLVTVRFIPMRTYRRLISPKLMPSLTLVVIRDRAARWTRRDHGRNVGRTGVAQFPVPGLVLCVALTGGSGRIAITLFPTQGDAVVATSDVLNALNGGVGRLSRRPLWVGAFAFLLLTAVGAVALMSVAIGALATLRVAYTTSIDRLSNVTTTDQRLSDRQSRPQTMTPLSPVAMPNEAAGHPSGATDLSGPTLPRSDLAPSETPQPAAPDPSSASSRSNEDPARSALTDLIEAQSSPIAPVTIRSDGGDEVHSSEPSASPGLLPAAPSGAVASSDSAEQAAAAAGSPRVPDIASTSAPPEADELGRLATAPLPDAVTAAALSHLRHALKRRTQARTIKHTVLHKPAPRTALQNNNYRPFDPFQPATPPAAGASTHQKTW
jgi:hypothetical protein